MTAQLHDFPTRPEFAAQIEARQNRADIVAVAHWVLDNEHLHSDEELTDACADLDGLGEGPDQLRGEAFMYTLALRQRRERHEAARLAVSRREAPTGRIRRALGVLAGAVAAVSLAWLATEMAAAGIAGVML